MALQYAPFDEEPNNNKNTKNKTVKRRKVTPDLIKKMTKSTYLNEDTDNNDDSDLADFVPLNPPKLTSVKDIHSKSIEQTNHDDEVKSAQELNPQQSAINYYSQYTPTTQYHMPSQHMPPNSNQLMEKLNYMIQLLEEQQDEKTNTVTEELILYAFLGIFIIFIIDSFARAGKYVR